MVFVAFYDYNSVGRTGSSPYQRVLVPIKHDQTHIPSNLQEWVRRMYENARKVHARPRSLAPQLRFQVSILPGARAVASRTVRLPPPPARLCRGSRRKPVPGEAAHSSALDGGWAPGLRLLLGCSSWTRWEAAITAGPGLPSSTAGQQNNRQQALSSWQLSGREAQRWAPC